MKKFSLFAILLGFNIALGACSDDDAAPVVKNEIFQLPEKAYVLAEQSRRAIVIRDAETHRNIWSWDPYTACVPAAQQGWFVNPSEVKPPTGSGRRERISVNHNKFIIGIDFFFSVQIFFNIEGVFGVVVRGQLVVRVLGQVVLVAQKRSDATQLQNTLAAVQHRQLVPAQQFVAHLLERSAVTGAIATGV